MSKRRVSLVPIILLAFMTTVGVQAQAPKIVWTEQEGAIRKELGGLRAVSDDERGGVTKKIALEIRQLPAATNKVLLANGLANLSTEGFFGQDALQEVATTLASALTETPQLGEKGEPADGYVELATLVRYEHVTTSFRGPQMDAAMKHLQADDDARGRASFKLKDLDGKIWALKDLKGKVVLLNFWATWCPPCRKEMPDLDALYQQFKEQGLVVVSVSDETLDKVAPYIRAHPVSYPILLDPGRVTNSAYRIEGIPKTFVYGRDGKIVAQAIDMRTQRQFLEMLALAGLK